MNDDLKYRTFDGFANNLTHLNWGAANTNLLRKTPEAYADGISSLAVRGDERTNARNVSNTICRQTSSKLNSNGLSDYIWAWGQFLDHEMDLTGGALPKEAADINVEPGDSRLPEGGKIGFNRSEYNPETGTSHHNPRQQPNRLSSYIDASNVYGNNPARAGVLRTFDGTGRLKVTKNTNGDLLPFNTTGLPNAQRPGPHQAFFVAGDIRANEHAVLTSMHTLFVREHNRLCLEIIAREPQLLGDDEALYQRARKIVGGQMQAITYYEFLPALLGEGAVSEYTGYKDDVNAGIANVFSTACYRLGHSMLSSHIKVGTNGETIRLRDAFFDPNLVIFKGIDPFLSGLAMQVMQEVDVRIVDDVREFLFTRPDNVDTLLDLAALNIQRGRDHGLPDYNTCREAYGLHRATGFTGVTRNRDLQSKLKQVYYDVNNIDPWIGGLAENHVEGSNVGEFVFFALKDQFERCRDGDRFWYEIDAELSAEEKTDIGSTRLSDIIRRNTAIDELPDNVFVVGPEGVKECPVCHQPRRRKTEAEPV